MKAAVLFTAALLLAAGVSAADGLKGGSFSPARLAPAIRAETTTGKPVQWETLRGKVVVLEFGYTSCADVCPVSLATLATARKELGDKLQVIFVSVDPARDKPQVLKEYLANFDKSFIGVTGTQAQIDAVLKDYGISATRKMIAGGKDYVMAHSSYLYFVDPQGRLRSMLPFGRPASDVVHDVNLLAQP